MGLDSVEIVMNWESVFGIQIPDRAAENLRTPRDATDLIADMLGAQRTGPSLTQRAFHRLRRAFVSAAGLSRDRVRPKARLRELVRGDRRQTWKAIRGASGFPGLPEPGWFSPRTVADLIRWATVHAIPEMKPPGEPWTRAEVRCVVRAVVMEHTGLKEFGDDDQFVRDLGID